MAEPDDDGIVFGRKAVEQIGQTVREVARRMMNETPQRGRWQQRPGGASGEFMWFSIVEVHCPDDYDTNTYMIVTPIYYSRGCTKIPPGANDDGTYNVYELCSDGFDGQVADELVGTIGSAHYVYPWQAEACEPLWVVDQLCHLPEC